jgi:hypothetical protein
MNFGRCGEKLYMFKVGWWIFGCTETSALSLYSQQDIWEAVNTGFAYLQNGAATSALPRFNARFYPHGFQGVDEGLQYTPTGAGNWNAAYEFPLAPRNGSPWNGGGYAPGPDRVVFDNNGIYMGVITHRGEINNAFQ